MPANYVLLEKITVGAAGASSVTFSGIPQTGYTDLVVKISSRSTSNGGYTYVSFNGSTTTYSTKDLVNSNGTVLSASYVLPGGVSWMTQSSYTPSTFTNSEVYIPNYTSANYKSFSLDSTAENNSTNYVSGLEAALWSNTAAITSITCTPNTANYAEFSTFYLYGVAKLGTTPVIAPYATGGDTIMTDGTFWYHAFLSSGTFTPAKALSCDVLVVAGGGGSRADVGGGGGAGGVIYFAGQSLSTENKTVTVGGGGSAGSNGSNSTFDSLTAASGGGIPGNYFANGVNGGSGGGGGGNPGFSNQSSTGATAAYGNRGGYGGQNDGGGGGGAGAVGVDYGAGGIGINAFSSWASATSTGVSGYYAGGGGGSKRNSGGSAGGTGGGGQGNQYTTDNGTNGVANTGGGGGGQDFGPARTGGSGIVIVRYLV